MDDYWKCIKIITRPKDPYGFYEYYMDTRDRRFVVLPSKEPKKFIRALKSISNGATRPDYFLTRPSKKDKGVKMDSPSEFILYRLSGALLFFPNKNLLNEWIKSNLSCHCISEPNPPQKIRGIRVLNLEASFIDE